MLTDIALIVLLALLGNLVFARLGLPGILGMMAAGMLLGPSVMDVIEPGVVSFLKEAKTAALIVILIRAGLGISRTTLHRIGGPAVRMSFVPGIVEGAMVMGCAHLMLGLPVPEAGMLGFIIAAVSPAVVVPTMLELKEAGFGKQREVPTLVLAGASVDDVFAITIFGVFAGLATGTTADWRYLLLSVPGGILAGALIGVVIGFVLVWFFRRYHMRDTRKVILFMIIAVVFHDLVEAPALKEVLPIAALLGVMAIGFVILERYPELATRLASKFGKIWVLAEVLLFAYIGTEVRFEQLSPQLLGVGLLILLLGLTARSVGVWLALLGSELDAKEKLFCVIAYWPKATVQAAMGAVPLSMVSQGRTTSMTLESGQTILAIAVLSIVVTAPMGAIGIKLTGRKLLSRERPSLEG